MLGKGQQELRTQTRHELSDLLEVKVLCSNVLQWDQINVFIFIQGRRRRRRRLPRTVRNCPRGGRKGERR